jgi:hypothetical protein
MNFSQSILLIVSLISIFSFGLTMWEIYSHRQPFHDRVPSAIRTAVLAGQRPEWKYMCVHETIQNEGTPSDYHTTVAKAMAFKDVVHSYQTLVQACWGKSKSARPDMDEVVASLVCLRDQVIRISAMHGGVSEALPDQLMLHEVIGPLLHHLNDGAELQSSQRSEAHSVLQTLMSKIQNRLNRISFTDIDASSPESEFEERLASDDDVHVLPVTIQDDGENSELITSAQRMRFVEPERHVAVGMPLETVSETDQLIAKSN